jgi:hypothetical protein
MPVNMDPKRKRKPKPAAAAEPSVQKPPRKKPANSTDPDSPTEADLAEKEWTNLWDATEVIDMDKW